MAGSVPALIVAPRAGFAGCGSLWSLFVSAWELGQVAGAVRVPARMPPGPGTQGARSSVVT
jgi:hypothetical protein